MTIVCPGVVVTDASGAPLCQDEQGTPLQWQGGVPFDPASIDPVIASAAFGAGFVLVAVAWAIGRGFRAVLSMIGR